MTTITYKKQYPSEQYLNELITNIEFAARAPVEVVRAMAAELQKHRKAYANTAATKDGWISCSERMPDDGQHVIILCDGAFVLYAQYRDGEFFDVVRDGDEFFETQSRNVTHWMPLPEPPQHDGE